jgi:hypothetical protein
MGVVTFTLPCPQLAWILSAAWVLPMPDSSFVGYLGDADFHDGSIVSVEQHDGTVSVRIRGVSGKLFVLDFSGVAEVRAVEPEGMILYALSEMSCRPPLRRFVFANWDDESKAHLEVEATGFAISSE